MRSSLVNIPSILLILVTDLLWKDIFKSNFKEQNNSIADSVYLPCT